MTYTSDVSCRARRAITWNLRSPHFVGWSPQTHLANGSFPDEEWGRFLKFSLSHAKPQCKADIFSSSSPHFTSSFICCFSSFPRPFSLTSHCLQIIILSLWSTQSTTTHPMILIISLPIRVSNGLSVWQLRDFRVKYWFSSSPITPRVGLWHWLWEWGPLLSWSPSLTLVGDHAKQNVWPS